MLAEGSADVVGLARPLVTDPDFSARVLRGEDVSSEVRPLKTGIGLLDGSGYLEIAWYEDAMRRLAGGQQVRAGEAPLLALARIAAETGLGAVLRRRRA